MNQPSQTIHIWTIGTQKGLLSFHEFGPQGPCPGAKLELGLKVKSRSLFKCVVYNVNVSSLSPYLKTNIGRCSYLDQICPVGFAFIQLHHILGTVSRGGVGGQNL